MQQQQQQMQQQQQQMQQLENSQGRMAGRRAIRWNKPKYRSVMLVTVMTKSTMKRPRNKYRRMKALVTLAEFAKQVYKDAAVLLLAIVMAEAAKAVDPAGDARLQRRL